MNEASGPWHISRMSGEGPRAKDWALFAISLAFVLAGAFLLPTNRDVAIVSIALFGLAGVVFAGTLRRKRRDQRLRPLRAELTGGVPIRPSRTKSFYLGAGLAGLGGVLIVFGGHYPDLFRALSWFIAGVGVLLLLGLAVGWIPAGYVLFDPAGITIGLRSWSYRVPWQSVVRMAGGEFHSHPVLLLWLDDVNSVQANPPERHQQAVERLRSNETWVGAHVMLVTDQYAELDLPLLLEALQRYLADPSARAELRPRVGLAQGQSVVVPSRRG